MEVTYKLACNLGPNVNYDRTIVSQDGFNYGYISDDFAISDNPENWILSMKIFNFNMFSDNNQTYEKILQSSYFSGQRNIIFEVPLTNISAEKYIVGDMLYYEIRLKHLSNARQITYIERQLIQISGLNTFKEFRDTNYLIVFLIMGVGICVICGFVYCYMIRKKKSKKYLKSE